MTINNEGVSDHICVYLHKQNDVSVLRMACSDESLLDLLLDALVEVAAELHRLESDQRLDAHQVEHCFTKL